MATGYPVVFCVSVALSFCSFGLALYRLFFHSLAKFPGPKLAAVTRFYEAYYDVVKGGQYTFKIAELHKEYGPIIRISPYELHVIDPSFYEGIYTRDGHWEKYSWAYRAFPARKSTICTIDHNVHKGRRATLNPIFSKTKIVAHEDMIRTHIEKLFNLIDAFTTSGSVLHLGIAYTAMAMDIITEFLMGKSYNNLDQEDFNEGMMDVIKTSGTIWRTAKHIPWILPIIGGMPIWMVKILDEKAAQFMAFRQDCMDHVREMQLQNETGSVEAEYRNTLVNQILQSPNLPPSEKAYDSLEEGLETITGAGLETTAQVLRVITFHIYSNTKVLHRLRAELKDAPNKSGKNTRWTSRQLEQLPYLTAVIMEGLRISPGLATRQARVAPDRDLKYRDWVTPAGTPLGMTTLLMHHNEDLYPHPRSFDPERWMDTDRRRQLEKVYAPFSRGTRICLGMHLAWAELYLTTTMIVSSFDFEFVGTKLGDVECGSDVFSIGTKNNNGLKVLVKRVQGDLRLSS